MEKVYLGDAVYAEWDGMHIVLTAEDGVRATNTIFLDDQVIAALQKYIAKLENELSQ